MVTTTHSLLHKLTETVKTIILFYKQLPNKNHPVDRERTALDILKHIVFWHESFAKNTYDLAHNIPPSPLKGSYATLTQSCQETLKDQNTKQLLSRLSQAHQTITQNICNPNVTIIPYKIGSRSYTPIEHLDIVNSHLLEHLSEVTKAIRSQSSVSHQT